MIYKILFLLITGHMLTGCAQYQWQKYGSTANDYNRDVYGCNSETARMYTPLFMKEQLTQGHTTPSTTNCSANVSGNVNCVTTPGTYKPGVSVTVDENENNREQAFIQCMYARGWQRVLVE